ncbi:MAG: hypothetical protein V3S88_01615 [Alphaproteobacteria bacterium]
MSKVDLKTPPIPVSRRLRSVAQDPPTATMAETLGATVEEFVTQIRPIHSTARIPGLSEEGTPELVEMRKRQPRSDRGWV